MFHFVALLDREVALPATLMYRAIFLPDLFDGSGNLVGVAHRLPPFARRGNNMTTEITAPISQDLANNTTSIAYLVTTHGPGAPIPGIQAVAIIPTGTLATATPAGPISLPLRQGAMAGACDDGIGVYGGSGGGIGIFGFSGMRKEMA